MSSNHLCVWKKRKEFASGLMSFLVKKILLAKAGSVGISEIEVLHYVLGVGGLSFQLTGG